MRRKRELGIVGVRLAETRERCREMAGHRLTIVSMEMAEVTGLLERWSLDLWPCGRTEETVDGQIKVERDGEAEKGRATERGRE